MTHADELLAIVPDGYILHVYDADLRPAFIWDLPNLASLDFAGTSRARLRRAIGYRRPRSGEAT